MLKGSIALEVSEEFGVRDNGFVAAFGDHGQIVQVLQQLLVVADREDDGGAVAVLVGEILQGLAHGAETTPRLLPCRGDGDMPSLSLPAQIWVGFTELGDVVENAMKKLSQCRNMVFFSEKRSQSVCP